jgi:citrate lyase subunit beta / citryl-CoA lyase
LKRSIGIEVLIEEVQALEHVEEICKAHPRLECVIFGMGDYSASQGIDIRSIGSQSPYPGDIWHYPRFRMAMAARSAGIDPVDGPYANFRNPEVFREECRRAMILGCVGKWAIHPAQIEPALEIFTPTQEDVDRARKLAAAYAKAEAEGLGAVNVDGLMIDAASIRILNNTLRKAELIGM